MATDDRVLAPNATVIHTVAQDPPFATPEYAFPIVGGDGYVTVRDGYNICSVQGAKEGFAHHCFATIHDLAEYLTRNFEDRSHECDVIIDASMVTVYVNPKSSHPQRLYAKMAHHPCWTAWMRLIDEPLTQKQLMQHIRAWRRDEVDNAEALMATLGTISVIGNSKVTSTVDETGATRLVGQEDSRNLSVKIPPTITFTSPVFDGVMMTDDGEEARYSGELLLSVDTSTPVTFELTFPKLPLVEREALRDARNYLAGLLGDGWLVSAGTAEHKTRPVGV